MVALDPSPPTPSGEALRGDGDIADQQARQIAALAQQYAQHIACIEEDLARHDEVEKAGVYGMVCVGIRWRPTMPHSESARGGGPAAPLPPRVACGCAPWHHRRPARRPHPRPRLRARHVVPPQEKHQPQRLGRGAWRRGHARAHPPAGATGRRRQPSHDAAA